MERIILRGFFVLALIGAIFYGYTTYQDVKEIINYSSEYNEIIIINHKPRSSRPSWVIVGNQSGKNLKEETFILEGDGVESLIDMEVKPGGHVIVKGSFTGETKYYKGEDYIGLGFNNPIRIFEGTSYEKFSSIKLTLLDLLQAGKR